MGDETDSKASLNGPILEVICGQLEGRLHKDRFYCPGIHQECIEYKGDFVTPKTFTVLADKTRLKNWKNAIRWNGMSIRKCIESGIFDFWEHDKYCSGRCQGRTVSKLETGLSYPTEETSGGVMRHSGDSSPNILTDGSPGLIHGLPARSHTISYRPPDLLACQLPVHSGVFPAVVNHPVFPTHSITLQSSASASAALAGASDAQTSSPQLTAQSGSLVPSTNIAPAAPVVSCSNGLAKHETSVSSCQSVDSEDELSHVSSNEEDDLSSV